MLTLKSGIYIALRLVIFGFFAMVLLDSDFFFSWAKHLSSLIVFQSKFSNFVMLFIKSSLSKGLQLFFLPNFSEDTSNLDFRIG